MCIVVPSKAKLLQNRPLACVSFASTISFLGPMAHNHGEMPLQNSFKAQNWIHSVVSGMEQLCYYLKHLIFCEASSGDRAISAILTIDH